MIFYAAVCLPTYVFIFFFLRQYWMVWWLRISYYSHHHCWFHDFVQPIIQAIVNQIDEYSKRSGSLKKVARNLWRNHVETMDQLDNLHFTLFSGIDFSSDWHCQWQKKISFIFWIESFCAFSSYFFQQPCKNKVVILFRSTCTLSFLLPIGFSDGCLRARFWHTSFFS